MFILLASRFDDGASALASSWGEDAAILAPEDLSRRGWSFDPDDIAGSIAVICGRPVPCPAITGVLTLLPRVLPQELAHIIGQDRHYVATEMSAFLLAWLSALRCPVVNRAQPGCLNGPAWTMLRWRNEALRAGFRVSSARDASTTITVIGNECFGSADEPLRAAARRLASNAGVQVASIRVDRESAFVSASPRPDLTQPQAAAAMKRLLEGTRP